MQKISLDALARQLMESAATAGGHHTADTVYGGHEKVLRQTVIGMMAGSRLAEHRESGRGDGVGLARAGVDWMWESTAVTLLALACGMLGAASRSRDVEQATRADPRGDRRALRRRTRAARSGADRLAAARGERGCRGGAAARGGGSHRDDRDQPPAMVGAGVPAARPRPREVKVCSPPPPRTHERRCSSSRRTTRTGSSSGESRSSVGVPTPGCAPLGARKRCTHGAPSSSRSKGRSAPAWAAHPEPHDPARSARVRERRAYGALAGHPDRHQHTGCAVRRDREALIDPSRPLARRLDRDAQVALDRARPVVLDGQLCSGAHQPARGAVPRSASAP